MGVIRGFFLVVVIVLLFASLLCVNLFWILSSSLEYENVQKEVPPIVTGFLDGVNATSIIDQNYDLIILYCEDNPDTNYVFNEEDYTFTISCDSALKGKDAMIEESVKSLIDNIYYADYDCGFLECFKENQIPLFIISENSYNFWYNKFYIVLIASFVLLILTFILIEKKTNMPILAGSLLIISSLPFFKLNSILPLFADKNSVKLLGIFFSQAYPVSLKTLGIGIILLILGIILKFFKLGFFISNLINKIKKKPTVAVKKQKPFIKQIIKKPVQKISKKKSK